MYRVHTCRIRQRGRVMLLTVAVTGEPFIVVPVGDLTCTRPARDG